MLEALECWKNAVMLPAETFNLDSLLLDVRSFMWTGWRALDCRIKKQLFRQDSNSKHFSPRQACFRLSDSAHSGQQAVTSSISG